MKPQWLDRLAWAAALALPVAFASSGPPLGGAPSPGVVASAAQNGPRTVWDGVYTGEQAKRGEDAYKLSCGYCHRDDLAGGFFDDGTGRAPALAGVRAFDSSFSERWSGRSVGEMLTEIGSIMPLDAPGSLTLPVYTDIIAYLLSKNDAPAGPSELPPDIEALGQIRIGPKPAR